MLDDVHSDYYGCQTIALGLPDTGFDAISPTLRCALTESFVGLPRFLVVRAAQKIMARLEIWPNGVAASRKAAQACTAKYEHYKLSVEEYALLARVSQ